LLADKFLLASQPAHAVAVGAIVTALTPVPPSTIGNGVDVFALIALFVVMF
jgi:hypothetical protein